MNILIIGGGGREHALAWKIARSPKTSRLYIAPGNAGTADLGDNVSFDINDFQEVGKFAIQNKIDMVVVGPEAPLVGGIHDYFLENDDLNHIHVIGPTRKAAMLEGSKDFAKGFMKKYKIPTGTYRTFSRNEVEDAISYLQGEDPPYVLKADGLAAGKGVLICRTLDQAIKELKSMLSDRKFGKASEKVIIEQHLEGIEISVFILTDGKNYKILPSAKDYKRIGEGDTGLNTGGMGSISPVPFADGDFMRKVEQKIIKPTIEGLNCENITYKGFIFFGLMNSGSEPYVIEYNARMGDPEAESVIPRISTDIVDLFEGVAHGNLDEKTVSIDPRYTAAVMLVSGGYPGSYEKGKLIHGLDAETDCLVFHAGTKKADDDLNILTNGGRVLALTAFGTTLQKALDKVYNHAKEIDFDKKYYRSDLGKDLLQYLK